MNTRIEFIRVFFIPLFFTHKVISFTDSPVCRIETNGRLNNSRYKSSL